MRFVIAALAALLTSEFLVAQAPSAPPNLLDTLRLQVRHEHVFGQRLAYYESGPAAAPTLILLPPLGWDAHAWAQNVPALARSYHVIVLDPLGTGRSDKPLIEYKMGTWTDGFAEFMRLKRIERAVFIGTQMGGALSVQMALDYPERVAAIVVAASSSGPGRRQGGGSGAGWVPTLAGIRAELRDQFLDTTFVTDSLVRARFAARLAAGDGYTVQRHVADHRPPYTVEELGRVAVPALIVWCREDRITPLSWGEDFAKPLPAGRLAVIERCGHFPNMEQPAAFNDVVATFLAAELGGPPSPRRTP